MLMIINDYIANQITLRGDISLFNAELKKPMEGEEKWSCQKKKGFEYFQKHFLIIPSIFVRMQVLFP